MFRLAFLLALLLPAGTFAAQLTDSFYKIVNTSNYRQFQLIRCDISGDTPGLNAAVGGETCASGDHSRPVSCKGFANMSAYFFEYGTGSGEAKIWNCITPVGAAGSPTDRRGTISTVSGVGVEAPAGTPTGADPDPFCTDLTLGASVTLDGVTTTIFSLSNTTLDTIVGEIQTCTANCDSTLVITCSP